jgi:hypothetical protein
VQEVEDALEGQASIPLIDPAMPGYLASKSGEILNSGFKLPGASIEKFSEDTGVAAPIAPGGTQPSRREGV